MWDKILNHCDRISCWYANATGHPAALVLMMLAVLLWAAGATWVGLSAVYVGVGTFIISLPPLFQGFAIQNSAIKLEAEQRRMTEAQLATTESILRLTEAMNLKIEELIRALPRADNSLIGKNRVEDIEPFR